MTEIKIITTQEQPTAVVRERVPLDQLSAFFQRAFTATMQALVERGAQPAGPPFGCYHGRPGETIDVSAGFPVSEPITPAGDVQPGTLPAGRAVEALHVGSYDTLSSTYDLIQERMLQEGFQPAPDMWESYLSDPEAEPDPATWRTRVVWPIS